MVVRNGELVILNIWWKSSLFDSRTLAPQVLDKMEIKKITSTKRDHFCCRFRYIWLWQLGIYVIKNSKTSHQCFSLLKSNMIRCISNQKIVGWSFGNLRENYRGNAKIQVLFWSMSSLNISSIVNHTWFLRDI